MRPDGRTSQKQVIPTGRLDQAATAAHRAKGQKTTIATGGRNGLWTGMALHDGQFYIAEGGELTGGRILRVTQNGQVTADGRFATMGDHHTNGPAIGPEDGSTLV